MESSDYPIKEGNNSVNVMDSTGFNGEINKSYNDETTVTTIESPTTKELDSFVERATWSNKMEFVLSTMGVSIGLGCVWRFPYMCYNNGGGAFLIPFLLFLITTGFPMFFMEISLGQFPSRSVVALWNMCPAFKGVGYAMVFVNTCMALYYNVIISWALYFLVASMQAVLPWYHCNNSWNDKYCIDLKSFKNFTGDSINVDGTEIMRKEFKSPSEQYFYNHVLQMSPGIENTGTVVWQLSLYLLLTWVIVFLVLIKGISSLGKVSYVTIFLPYILLTVNLVRGVTLDGAVDGIIYYLKPDFSKLTNAKTWIDACTQVIFSLSIGTGSLHNMGSFSRFNNNSLRDAMTIPFMTVLTGLFAGFSVFSILGFMAKQKGVSVDEVAIGGPGLVFVTFPEGVSTMPLPSIWSCLFFIMLVLLGLSAQFTMVESVLSAIMDEIPVLRSSKVKTLVFRAVACSVFYLLGLTMVTNGGFYIFSLVDGFIGGFAVMITTLMELLVVMWVYGYSNLSRDIEMMIGRKPPFFYKASWGFLSPALICSILIFYAVKYERLTLFMGKYKFPQAAELVGWSFIVIVFIFVISRFIFVVFQNGLVDILKKSFKPSKDWGPALLKHRTNHYSQDLSSFTSSSSDSQLDVKVTVDLKE